jgi:molybdopterin-guanine dinucleotide biosynthesis protein A
MMRFAIRSGVALAGLLAAGAMHHLSAAPRAKAAPAARVANPPGLGEIMSLQQMRHSKLWFAGSAGNWPLAGYELDELKEGFDDVRRQFPAHDGVRLGPLLAVIDKAAIPDLDKTIAAQDAAKFAGAFDALTAACNGCHQSAKHGFIVIQRPTNLPYSNQSFAPAAH